MFQTALIVEKIICKFPYSWLRTQANPDLSADKLEHLLTMAGLEVEEIDTAAPAFSGVVVAEVKSVESILMQTV